MKWYSKLYNNNEKKVVSKLKKKKTVCFIYYMVFNNSALLYREARTLLKQGFDVDVILLHNFKQNRFFQKFHGLNLYFIQRRNKAEKKVSQYLIRLGFFFIKAMVLISILGLKKKYQLVHVTTPPDFMVFATIVPKILGAKIILDIHDIGPELFMRKLHIGENRMIIKFLKRLEKIAAKMSNHVITVTDLWRDRLISRSVAPESCTVILNVPDEELFVRPDLPLSKTDDVFKLYYHGSLEEHFGVDTLLKAIPLIKQTISNFMLEIYGDGRAAESLKLLAQELKLNGYIQFHEKVPFYEIPQVLMDADLGIVPTKGDIFADEALSMKSLDYMALKIPVVISNTRAHRQYYNNTMVKFFKPDDPYSLAAAVIELIQNRTERIQLIQNAYSFIEKHGWQETQKQYLKIVNSLLDGLG